MANFIFQVICAWVLLCVPGLIVVSSHLFFGDSIYIDSNETNKNNENANEIDITCYEDTEEYFPIVMSSRFWIEGIRFFIINQKINPENIFQLTTEENEIMSIKNQFIF